MHRLVWLVGVLAFVVSGCGVGSEEGEGAAALDETGWTSAALSSSGCGSGVRPGTYDASIVSSGVNRSYRIIIPPSYRSTVPSRVVLSFHGRGGTDLQQASGGLAVEGAANNYITVFPQGLGNAWNSGPQCCSTANDVQFARDVVADVSAHVCVDSKRVFATGFSNGAMMAQRLACQAADVFAAVVSVAGALMLQPTACNPVRPVSVLVVHGTADNGVCWNGNTACWDPNFYMSVPANNQFWRTKNGVTASPVVFYSMGAASCQRWSPGLQGSAVELCTIAGGGHCTPGTSGCNRDLSADMAVSAFTAAHPMP